MKLPRKTDIQAVLDILNDEEDLSDEQYWLRAHDMLNLPYGKLFDILAADKKAYGVVVIGDNNEN